MPTVVKPQPEIVGRNKDRVRFSTAEVLDCLSLQKAGKRIVRTSTLNTDFGIVPNESGFVNTVIRAFQQDLHLRLRPDDVWLAILIQFGFYVTKHEAALRHVFVAHEGKKEIKLDARVIDGKPTTLETVDFGVIARLLSDMVTTHLKDPEIAATLLPEFTTTTTDDKGIMAVALLGVMKQYFDYAVFIGCGFPSVTLLGEREDWASMLARVSWIASLNDDLADWVSRLSKVLEYMVASFDRPEDDDVKDFWIRAVHENGPTGSPLRTELSGWLTAFCWWTVDGDRLRYWYGQARAVDLTRMNGWDRDDSDDDDSYVPAWRDVCEGRIKLPPPPPPPCLPTANVSWSAADMSRGMKLGDVVFPTIDREKLPAAIAEVPLKVIQEGMGEEMMSLQAGLVGMEIRDESATTAQPISGWWVSAKH